MLERFNVIISVIDYSLNTQSRRHITGGILLSISFIFWLLGAHDNDYKNGI